MNTPQNFPQYRKTLNEKSFYKIISASEVIEIQFIGSKTLLHHLIAKILPERNHISDLIENSNQIWVKINEQEFENVYQRHLKENKN